jgi:hypothetical protein
MNLVSGLPVPTPHTLQILTQKIKFFQNHTTVLDTFNVPVNGLNDYELSHLYWFAKFHESTFKHKCIAGSSKCSTKPLYLLLTNICTTVKEKLQMFCTTTYARSGVHYKSDVDSQKF